MIRRATLRASILVAAAAGLALALTPETPAEANQPATPAVVDHDPTPDGIPDEDPDPQGEQPEAPEEDEPPLDGEEPEELPEETPVEEPVGETPDETPALDDDRGDPSPDASPAKPRLADTHRERAAQREQRNTARWQVVADSPTPVLAGLGATLATVVDYTLTPIIQPVTRDILGPIVHPVDQALAPVTRALTPVLDLVRCILAPVLVVVDPILGPVLDVVVPAVGLPGTLTPVVDAVTPPPSWPVLPGLPGLPSSPTGPGEGGEGVPGVPGIPVIPGLPVELPVESPSTPTPTHKPAPNPAAASSTWTGFAGLTATHTAAETGLDEPAAHVEYEPPAPVQPGDGDATTGGSGQHVDGTQCETIVVGIIPTDHAVSTPIRLTSRSPSITPGPA